MSKNLHIYMGDNYPKNQKLLITLQATEKALNSGESEVHTTQPHVCSTRWLVDGYRIFVHMLDEEIVEVKLGNMNGREIRVSHNLEKMLLANSFGYATIR